jgi:hypothetical protein
VEIISYEKFNDDLNDSSLKNRVKIAMDSAWSSESYQELSKLIKKRYTPSSPLGAEDR